MVYFLYGVFFLSCIVLVAAVLLQPGKTDAGALFTSNVSSSAFSPRGTATVLSKVTIVAAVTFMLSALFLAMPAFDGNVSVLSGNPDGTDVTSSSDANANTAGSNSNTAIPADTSANVPAPVAGDANTSPAPNTRVADEPLANAPAKSETANNAPVKAPANK